MVGREVKKNVEEWSFVSQGDHWIDPGGAARGDVACQQGCDDANSHACHGQLRAARKDEPQDTSRIRPEPRRIPIS